MVPWWASKVPPLQILQVFTNHVVSFLLTGPGLGQACLQETGNGKEHLLKIVLDVTVAPNYSIRDSFEWDLACPDNQPEEFAAQLVADHMLSLDQKNSERHFSLSLKLENAVAMEIRKQINLHCTHLAKTFKDNFEAFVADEVDREESPGVSVSRLGEEADISTEVPVE